MALDAPPPGTVKQPFTVSGWAIDCGATSGSGVNAVHVYAYPSDASGTPIGPPVLAKVANYGTSRPDVGAAFGSRFANSGYVLEITGLRAGYYHLVIFAHSTVSDAWNQAHRVIRVPEPLMNLDAPAEGSTVRQPFTVSGWAIDQSAASGPGVDVVHVYVYPADASGVPTGPPVLGKAAGYGLSRPDVGAAFGGQFTNSGYALEVSGLAGGNYHLVVFAHSSISGQWQQGHRVFLVG